MASKPLTRFVNAHPTVILLCLSFLLMIGFSLIADGFGYSLCHCKNVKFIVDVFNVCTNRIVAY